MQFQYAPVFIQTAVPPEQLESALGHPATIPDFQERPLFLH
jgi:hypothetical protein